MALTLAGAPIPLNERIVTLPRPQFAEKGEEDPQAGFVNENWAYYFTTLTQVLQQAPNRISTIAITAQQGSIAATDLSGGSIGTGLYRLSYYARITAPAGGSSSLQVVLQWTDHGVGQVLNGAAMTGNTLGTFQQGGGLIFADAATPVSYSTLYSSSGIGAMLYELYICLETISA